jgi:hypothetical protein
VVAVATPELTVAPHDHVVQLYDHDAELTSAVGPYLAEGLAAGDAVVIIATPEHRAGIAAELTALGVDVDHAIANGDYLALDAAATLAEFTVDGWPHSGRFDAVVGRLVRDKCNGGRALRAYGEMVALLWEDNRQAAAIELEMLWNDLRRRERFALYCAYRMTPDLDGLAQVCSLHGGVVPAAAAHTAVHAYAPTTESATAARAFVVGVLLRAGAVHLIDDASVVIAELAANAVIHARTAFEVSIDVRDTSIRLAVRDASPIMPAAREGGVMAPSGRGLHMITATATRWGSDAVPGGKVVWAELAR